jgi:hypothetical protein
MYFPYFFSNQYEMETVFRLRDEVQKDLVLPIIVPYKRTKSITNILAKIVASEMKFILVLNSEHIRSDIKDQIDIKEYIDSFIEQDFPQVVLGIYIDSQNIDMYEAFIDQYSDRNIAIFFKNIKKLEQKRAMEIVKKSNVIYAFFQGEATKFSFHTDFNDLAFKVVLEDAFKKQPTNMDYKNHEDEKFYDLHLRYKELGYHGFGDFLTIGSHPSDASTPNQPATVVIHYTYPDGIENETIRIKRFFGDWDKEIDILSDGTLRAMQSAEEFIIDYMKDSCTPCAVCDELISKVKRGKHYSNLGELKKFSMLHHVYMVIKLIY